MTKHEPLVRQLAASPLCGHRFMSFIRRWEMNVEPPPKEESQPVKYVLIVTVHTQSLILIVGVFEIPDVWVEILTPRRKKITSMPMMMKAITIRRSYLPKSVAVIFMTKILHLSLPTYAGVRRRPCTLP